MLLASCRAMTIAMIDERLVVMLSTATSMILMSSVVVMMMVMVNRPSRFSDLCHGVLTFRSLQDLPLLEELNLSNTIVSLQVIGLAPSLTIGFQVAQQGDASRSGCFRLKAIHILNPPQGKCKLKLLNEQVSCPCSRSSSSHLSLLHTRSCSSSDSSTPSPASSSPSPWNVALPPLDLLLFILLL